MTEDATRAVQAAAADAMATAREAGAAARETAAAALADARSVVGELRSEALATAGRALDALVSSEVVTSAIEVVRVGREVAGAVAEVAQLISRAIAIYDTAVDATRLASLYVSGRNDLWFVGWKRQLTCWRLLELAADGRLAPHDREFRWRVFSVDGSPIELWGSLPLAPVASVRAGLGALGSVLTDRRDAEAEMLLDGTALQWASARFPADAAEGRLRPFLGADAYAPAWPLRAELTTAHPAGAGGRALWWERDAAGLPRLDGRGRLRYVPGLPYPAQAREPSTIIPAHWLPRVPLVWRAFWAAAVATRPATRRIQYGGGRTIELEPFEFADSGMAHGADIDRARRLLGQVEALHERYGHRPGVDLIPSDWGLLRDLDALPLLSNQLAVNDAIERGYLAPLSYQEMLRDARYLRGPEAAAEARRTALPPQVRRAAELAQLVRLGDEAAAAAGLAEIEQLARDAEAGVASARDQLSHVRVALAGLPGEAAP